MTPRPQTLAVLLLCCGIANGVYKLTADENAALQSNCGLVRTHGADSLGQFKIFGGVRATRHDFPWAVVIHVVVRKDRRKKLSACSGSIVSPRHIITVAHCFYRTSRESNISSLSVSVFAGSACFNCSAPHIYGRGRRLSVKSVLLPLSAEPSLRPVKDSAAADFAIVELVEPLEDIPAICVSQAFERLPKWLTVYGFGYTRPGSTEAGELRSFELALSSEDCARESRWRPHDVPTSGLLARRFGCKSHFTSHVDLREHNQSICNVDSGGGASAVTNGRHVLFGVITEGGSLCDQSHNSQAIRQTFDRVSYHHDFICKWTGICREQYNKYFNVPEEGIEIDVEITEDRHFEGDQMFGAHQRKERNRWTPAGSSSHFQKPEWSRQARLNQDDDNSAGETHKRG